MLENLKERINRLDYEISANKKVLDKTRLDLKMSEDQVLLINLASEVLKRIGDQKKQATVEVFERVVTAAIKEVFGFDYKFVILFDSEGKRVSTKFKLIDVNGNELDIMESVGGGLVDIISFTLRVLILASAKPKRSQILFMDENFRCVSQQYRPKVAELLKSLSKKLGIQFVLVTHAEEFKDTADICYELEKTENGTIARKL
jgi:DNA repair exonuclease SbcCD ATPase subunit